MTFNDLIAAHPELFYAPYVAWYEREKFMDEEPVRELSPFLRLSDVPPSDVVQRIYAVELAALYVKHPDATVWGGFIWTDDTDRWGNRVYVGGVGMYGINAFQIHRDLRPFAQWVAWA